VISSDGSSILDVIGVGEWLATGGTLAAFDRFETFIDPDALCLWRQAELVTIRSTEMDVNAAPTGDLSVAFKVVRVRPLEGTASGPVRLVS